jgi:hypothetical protein
MGVSLMCARIQCREDLPGFDTPRRWEPQNAHETWAESEQARTEK